MVFRQRNGTLGQSQLLFRFLSVLTSVMYFFNPFLKFQKYILL